MDNHNFTLTESAAERISFLQKTKPEGTFFRIAVLGGGCSGFQYKYNFDDKFDPEHDQIFISHNTKVVIDDVSLPLLDNSSLDFISNLTGSHFEMKNPNAQSGCGCGNSFSV